MNDPVDHDKVERALKALVEAKELSDAEQEVYLDRMAASYWDPSPVEDAFFSEPTRFDLGVGMDETGNIICQDPDAPTAPRNLDEWMAASIQNMKRMTTDEAYRKLIASRLRQR